MTITIHLGFLHNVDRAREVADRYKKTRLVRAPDGYLDPHVGPPPPLQAVARARVREQQRTDFEEFRNPQRPDIHWDRQEPSHVPSYDDPIDSL